MRERGKGGSISRRLTTAGWALIVALALGAVLSGAGRARAAGQTAKPGSTAFPLSAGTTWVYQAVVRWNQEGTAGGQEKLMAWTMKVEKAIPRGKWIAAVIRGFPRDLDRSHGDSKPAESLILDEGGAKFYWIPPEATAKTLARVENASGTLANLVSDDEIFLQLPLTLGDKFCGITGMIRTDGFYCWVAEEPQVADLAGIKGVPAGEYTAFPVQFLTSSEATSYDFVPGVGITRYSFQEHGTQSDTELRLEEFHPGAH